MEETWLNAWVAAHAASTTPWTLMCALMHAGLPYEDYAFGGCYYNGQFLLAEDGTLTEWTPEHG